MVLSAPITTTFKGAPAGFTAGAGVGSWVGRSVWGASRTVAWGMKRCMRWAVSWLGARMKRVPCKKRWWLPRQVPMSTPPGAGDCCRQVLHWATPVSPQ